MHIQASSLTSTVSFVAGIFTASSHWADDFILISFIKNQKHMEAGFLLWFHLRKLILISVQPCYIKLPVRVTEVTNGSNFLCKVAFFTKTMISIGFVLHSLDTLLQIECKSN